MLISKKELMNETHISYGQLYRWKREKLIPEEWFIKQPSFTGQETFFPKTKIINRIKAIQELKDKYSLEELAKILSPEVSERNFTVDDLQLIDEIDKGLIPCFYSIFGKSSFSYIDLLVLIAISSCKKEFSLQLKDIENLCQGVKDYLTEIKQTDFIFILLNKNGDYFIALHSEQAQIFIDKRLQILKQIRLNDVSSIMKLKYRKKFDFKFDDEEENIPFKLLTEGSVII
ncbi:MAG: DUF4004 family protein [Saccharofermentanales bacterium]